MYSGRTKILRLLFIADKYDSNEANLNAGAHEVAGRLVKGREKSSDASRSLSLSAGNHSFLSLFQVASLALASLSAPASLKRAPSTRLSRHLGRSTAGMGWSRHRRRLRTTHPDSDPVAGSVYQ